MRVKNFSGIVLRLAVILLCLVLFSAHLASGMFARYSTSAQGEDAARTAEYSVTITSVSDLPEFDADGKGVYKFKVTNESEVPVRYSLAADFTIDYQYLDFSGSESEIQSTKSYIAKRALQSVQLDDEDGVADGSNSLKYTFPQSDGVLDPGESKTLTLSIIADFSAFYSSHANITGAAENGYFDWEYVPIYADILAKTEQID